jgi:L-ribulose-5-phosphate 3-epimerase UlaE
MLLTLGLHKNSLVRSYSEHRILTPKIQKQSGKTVVTILVTTVSIFSMVLSASRRLPCGERPDGVPTRLVAAI